MAKKTEALYNALLPMKIVSFNDIVRQASKIIEGSANRKYVYRKYVKRLIETGKLQAIRKGLYAVLSPLEEKENYEPDKLLIASKIRKEYYLGFHTALEYYGCAYSAFNEAYICIQPKDRFNPFNYKRFTFKPVFVKDIISQVLEKTYQTSLLKVSSKERTFIECVDRPQYAGGWEECVKSLENLSGIDTEKLISLTLRQTKKALPVRVGYFLELLKNRSPFYEHISDETLTKLKTKVRSPPQYLVRGKKNSLNKRWNLYVPEGFEEELRVI
jgi:predicted transcriptional regulator of viral defense system